MLVSKSYIKADWILTVLNPDNTVVAVYEFPDNYVDGFFEAVNGFACQPMGDWAEANVKWGHSSAPIDLTSETLGDMATLTLKYGSSASRHWPSLSFGHPKMVNLPGQTPYYATGLFEYDPVTRMCRKTSGNYIDRGLDGRGNPINGSHIFIDADELVEPLREIGVSYDYQYTTYYHLDDDNNPVRTNPLYAQKEDLSGWDNPYISTRALILDANGNPTEIALSPGQRIKVERVEVIEFELPRPVTFTMPINEKLIATGVTTSRDIEVTLTMHDPLALDSYIKNAPPGPLLSVWWHQAYSCYNSTGQLIPIDGGTDDWIVAGWDPVNENWGTMQAHDYNVDFRWDSPPLQFESIADKTLAKIVIHDLGGVDTPDGVDWNVVCQYEFNPPIPLNQDSSNMFLRPGFRLKRHMSRIPR